MTDELRPDPDELLKALNRSDRASREGKLYLYFGMAAGAGKTFAMLETAQSRLRDGVDVVIGIVYTHGREETAALTRGLQVIPRKITQYHGTTIEEMDLDAILARRPRLVLVDELAHTNAPGSRHKKRWQDVIELLDAGIDVYTTLNVQHIESRKENIESITGIAIHETVPDTILERAAQIELVDITPDELLKRLREGKVYLGDMADRAAQNFFKEDRLTALREMALRLTAEKVDNDLQTLLALRGRVPGWKSNERLMVAISHSPTSANLIRTTRRIAFSLDAPWIAAYVDTGATLSEEDKAQLSRNRALVRELGGEIVSVAGPDVAEAIRRIALQRGITQIVFGRPKRRWLKDVFSGGSPLDRLVTETGNFDVLVLRQEKPVQRQRQSLFKFVPESGLLSYWYILWFIAAVSLLNAILNPLIGYRAIGFIFLLSMLMVSLFVSLGPILFAAILSALVWDYFFIPPPGTFEIRQPEDIIMGLAYFVVAVVTGTLTHRIRRRERMLRQREERTQTLYEIVRAIASGPSTEKFIEVITNRMRIMFNAECSVLLGDSSGNLRIAGSLQSTWMPSERDLAVAKYSFMNNKPSGWSTDTLPSAESLFLPLIGTSRTVGVLVFRLKAKAELHPEETEFLNTVARQLAIGIERDILNEQSRQARQLQESERLHQTILNSISHEIRTPLTTIMGAASALQSERISSNDETRLELTEELSGAAERLNLVVENLLDTSRLSSGMLSLKREWCDLKDLVSICLERLSRVLERHSIQINVPNKFPLLFVDFRLFEQVLSNLLRNAAIMSPAGSRIIIEATTPSDGVAISVADCGPGIPEESKEHIFERFYRIPGTSPGGVGLGLWLVKSIVELHGGRVLVTNQPIGGARFSIHIPLEKQPELPGELENSDGE